MSEKTINGNFTDNRIGELSEKVSQYTRDEAIRLQLPITAVIGVLENIKHDFQHEFQPVDGNLIEY